jgi:hypothetical protein
MISLERNKLLLLGGAAKDGKSKFLAQWMKRLIRTYGDQVMIVWGTFEDSGEDVFYNMISSDLIMKPKDIRLGKLLGKEQRFEQLKAEFEGYPVEFIENSVTSKYLKDTFVYIAKDNPKRIPILIVDNILTLGDRELFRHDNNAMYDYVMDNLHQARNLTKGIVICVHHYKDSQMGPDRLVNGYRPELPDLKGTEAFRRIPNHVMLFNNPHKRKELYKEYGGDMKDILKHLFLIDVGANRDDSSDDDQALIRMFHTLDYSIFEEI